VARGQRLVSTLPPLSCRGRQLRDAAVFRSAGIERPFCRKARTPGRASQVLSSPILCDIYLHFKCNDRISSCHRLVSRNSPADSFSRTPPIGKLIVWYTIPTLIRGGANAHSLGRQRGGDVWSLSDSRVSTAMQVALSQFAPLCCLSGASD
jgi:hypothetical protein